MDVAAYVKCYNCRSKYTNTFQLIWISVCCCNVCVCRCTDCCFYLRPDQTFDRPQWTRTHNIILCIVSRNCTNQFQQETWRATKINWIMRGKKVKQPQKKHRIGILSERAREEKTRKLKHHFNEKETELPKWKKNVQSLFRNKWIKPQQQQQHQEYQRDREYEREREREKQKRGEKSTSCDIERTVSHMNHHHSRLAWMTSC